MDGARADARLVLGPHLPPRFHRHLRDGSDPVRRRADQPRLCASLHDRPHPGRPSLRAGPSAATGRGRAARSNRGAVGARRAAALRMGDGAARARRERRHPRLRRQDSADRRRPKNEIGWIVLLYSAFVLSLRVGLEPYLDDLAPAARVFARAWALLLVVPLALFAYALGLRVANEGWTVERYFSAAYGLAAAIAALLQLLPRTRSDIRLIVGVLPVLLTLSTVGPWGVVATVGRSQTGLIERDFGASARRRRGDARSRRFAAKRPRLTPRCARRRGGGRPPREPPRRLCGHGAGRASGEDPNPDGRGRGREAEATRSVDQSFSTDGAWDVGGFDRVVPVLGTITGTDTIDPALHLEGQTLAVTYRGLTDRFDLIAGLPADRSSTNAGSLPALAVDLRSADGRTVRLRVAHLRWSATGELLWMQAGVALRHGEWASMR